MKPGVTLTCGCEVEEAGPELVLKRRNTSNRRAVVCEEAGPAMS